MLSRLRQVPLPLALILGVAVLLTVTWIVATPPMQGPDEPDHFAYVQKIVEQKTIPWRPGENCGEACPTGISSELNTALATGGVAALSLNAAAKDNYTKLDEERWKSIEQTLPDGSRANGAYRSTMRNGPVYYLYASLPYLAAYPADVFDRAFVTRLANVPLVIVVVIAAWVLTGILVGKRRWLQALAASIVALNAQLISIMAVVNADVMLATFYSVALALMAALLIRGPTRAGLIALAVCTAGALLSHPRGAAILVPAALTAAILLWRRTAPHGRRAVRAAAAGIVALTAIAGYVVVRVATRGDMSTAAIREFGSYLWQFYLPKLDSMKPSPRADWNVGDVFIERFWGSYLQSDVTVAPWVTDAMTTAARVGIVALIVVLIVRRRALARVWPAAVVLALALFSYVLAMHVGAWRNLDVGSTDPVLTGRYLTPFVVLLGAAVAVGVSWLPRRAGPAVAAAFVSAGFALHLAALGALVVRFHV